MPRGRPEHPEVGKPWVEEDEEGIHWCWVIGKELWGAVWVNLMHRTMIGRRVDA